MYSKTGKSIPPRGEKRECCLEGWLIFTVRLRNKITNQASADGEKKTGVMRWGRLIFTVSLLNKITNKASAEGAKTK